MTADFGKGEITWPRRDRGITWQTPLPGGDDALGWEVDVEIELVRRA